jgi:sodium/bile acid cotransporter 7
LQDKSTNRSNKDNTQNRWQQIQERLTRIGFDNFLLALLAMILLAYWWPGLGKEGGLLPLAEIGTYGVTFIFFFYGLRLSPEKLKAGLSEWRLHLVVQFTTFLLFPLLIFCGRWLIPETGQELLWLGTFYLAALPSTVSSSVVMVSIAGGNLPGAIFNASISSLLGVFITPLWMGLIFQNQEDHYNLWSVLGKLILQVIVPVLLGILLHSRWGRFAERYRQQLRHFDQFIILVIVFTAFCDSFARNQFQELGLPDILLLGLLMTGLFFLVFGLLHFLSRWLGFSRENRITALFCGSKKSLVQGTVMSKVIFANVPSIGLILLPLMLYHALQLIFASMLAQALSRRKSVAIKLQ